MPQSGRQEAAEKPFSGGVVQRCHPVTRTMLPPARRQELVQAYRQAMPVDHPPADPFDIGRAVETFDDILARGRYGPPGPNPFERIVTWIFVGHRSEVAQALSRALRPLLVASFSYAVPTESCLRRIAELGPIVEVGAGSGYWARCLAERGAAIRAFDRTLPADQRRKGGAFVEHFAIESGGPEAAAEALGAARTLLLCWPPGVTNREEVDAGAAPTFSNMGLAALAVFRGSRLVFIGERSDSFGSPAFFAALDRQYLLERREPLPNLGSWKDAALFFRRR